MAPDGVCHSAGPVVPEVDLTDDTQKDVPMKEAEASPMKRHCASPCSTAASTPIMTATSPEARAKARISSFAGLPVRQLKERIESLGGNITGMSEKTELVSYLDMLESL